MTAIAVMDGYEAATLIRKSAHKDAGNIPIFAMSANAFDEDISKVMHVGINGHIEKPIDTDLLYSKLAQLI